MRDEERRNMPLFPMGIITKLTELTPRQIRYYEQQGLISPARTKGNQRLFSFHDVDRLLQIRKWMEQGLNIAGVKKMLHQGTSIQTEKKTSGPTRNRKSKNNEVTERDLRKLLKKQLLMPGRPGQTHLMQGELTRFFRH